MSTFAGKISHFPSISIDNFENENLKSTVFLLSHCHTDHMKGLYNFKFEGPLHVSPISEVFINKQYPWIKTISINIGESKQLDVDDGVVVTAFPAYHCPGSVMFLLQGQGVTVLYTGDFRFNLVELKKIVALQKFKYDEIHLDSTFLSEEYEDFPTQAESVTEVCRLTEEWLERGDQNKVAIDQSAKVGYEFLYIELHKKLKENVYVTDEEFKKYRHIPELDVATTFNENARIHAGCRVKLRGPHVRKIRVSAWKWKRWEKGSPIKTVCDYHSVCYSNHSSLNEIRDFVRHLKPRRVFLNVLPEIQKESSDFEAIANQRHKMMQLVEIVMKEYQILTPEKKPDDNDTKTDFSNILKRAKRAAGSPERLPVIKRLNFSSKKAL